MGGGGIGDVFGSGGGGDLGSGGGGGDPFGGGGGGGPGGSSDPLAGDPSLTGSDPFGSTGGFDPSMFGGGTGDTSGATASSGGTTNPLDNPQVGSPQANAPPPGTTPFSAGGVPSGQASDTQMQQIIQRLSGGRQTSPSLPQLASRGNVASDAPQPGISDTGITPTTQPLSTDALQGRTDTGPAATAAGQQTANAPRGNVPIGATGQPIPPSTSTTPTPPTATSPGQPPPSNASLEPTPTVDQAKPPPTPTTTDTTPTPPATGATPPATGATSPTATGGQGQGGQGYGGGSPTQQQQLSPAKLIGDVIQAMFGNPQPLLSDIAGGQGQSGNWESAGNPPGVPPWAPGYGPQSRIPPGTQPPASLRRAAGGQPPAGNGATPEQIQAQQQSDVRQNVSSGQADPFGATGWTPENRVGLGPGAAPSPAAAEMTNQQSVARSRIAGSDTRPTSGFSNYLRQQRAPQASELQNNPRTKLEVAGMLALENAGDPIGPMESLLNRSNFYHQPISRLLHNGFYGPINRGQLQRGIAMYQNNPQLRARIDTAMQASLGGSNVLAGATDQGLPTDRNGRNPSGRVTRGTEVYNDHAPSAANWRRQQQQRVQEELRGGTGPRSELTPPARATGRDMLRGYTQTASLTDQGTPMPEPEDRMRDINNPPQTTNDPRYEPSWMTGVDPNLTIENLDRPQNGTPGS